MLLPKRHYPVSKELVQQSCYDLGSMPWGTNLYPSSSTNTTIISFLKSISDVGNNKVIDHCQIGIACHVSLKKIWPQNFVAFDETNLNS